MIEKLLSVVLTKPAFGRLAREELERLQEAGYLQPDQVEELLRQAQERLANTADSTRDLVIPLLRGVGGVVRDALDIPSRSEILALTEELRAARSADQQAP